LAELPPELLQLSLQLFSPLAFGFCHALRLLSALTLRFGTLTFCFGTLTLLLKLLLRLLHRVGHQLAFGGIETQPHTADPL